MIYVNDFKCETVRNFKCGYLDNININMYLIEHQVYAVDQTTYVQHTELLCFATDVCICKCTMAAKTLLTMKVLHLITQILITTN